MKFKVYQVDNGRIELAAKFRYREDASDYLGRIFSGYISHKGMIVERKNVEISNA